MRRILLLLVLFSAAAPADERILEFHSDIVIRSDGWLDVTETIRVRAEGRQINRGIYRDYPTRYTDRFGNEVEVEYEPISVSRNGMAEAFHTERQSNGMRTYFGSADRRLDPGEHTYTYRYRAGRMLGYFESHDELNWNVTGHGWDFPIDGASATVRFDFAPGDEAIRVNAYTGRFGEAGRDFAAEVGDDDSVRVTTTRTLPPRQGLTIVVGWQKGIVEKPAAAERVAWLLSDNSNLLAALAGLIGLFLYYIPVWRKHGKDPEAGVVFPRYEPPKGFSPASLRYIEQMHYDDTAMTAAIVNLAVKGYLKISNAGGIHALEKTTPRSYSLRLAAGERELYEELFRESRRIVLKDDNHKIIGDARTAHQASLSRDYAQRYFKTNGTLSIPGIAIALGASLLALNIGAGPTVLVVVTIVAMIAVVAVFAYLMLRPTSLGRNLLNKVSGFREFLQIAEKDEMHLRNPPEKTPELFEKYLPFALAVGVEQAWAERFESVLSAVRGTDGSSWHPAWYSGSWNSHSLAATTSSLGSDLGSAISSAATPPGSSSGGSGGFSGGGGGGGGGGGW